MDDDAVQPRDEADRLNSNDDLHEVSSLVFRLTDLHQPDLVQTLRLPVTAWPGEADVGVCPDSTIDSPGSLPQQDLVDLCARLLNGVDLRFLEGRDAAENVAEKGQEGRSTALVRLFEDAQPDIFGLASHASTSAPRERTGGRGENGEIGENKDGDPARSAENKRRHAQVKINSPVAAEKKKRRASGSRPPSARVAVQGTGRAALTAEEETQKSLGALLALFESFNAAAAGEAAGEVYLSDTRRVLRDVQGMTSVAFGVRAATFAQIPREVLFSVIQNLGSVVRRGAGTKVYSTSSEGDDACLRAEGAMEAAVLAERLILKAHGADSRDLVIPEETLDLCVEATRFHLHNNLLPFHCPRIKAAVRPDLHDEAATDDDDEKEDGDVEKKREEKEEEKEEKEEEDAEDCAVRDVAKTRGTRTRSTRSATTGSKAAVKATLKTAKNRKKEENGEGGGVRGVKKEKVKGGGATKTTTKTTTTARGNNSSNRVPPVVGRLKDRILASLDVISDITSVIKIQTSTLSPLVRTATQSVTVDRGLADVHGRCIAVLSAIHATSEDLRPSILPDVFGALAPHVGAGKRYTRDLPLVVERGAMVDVGVLSAMVLEMVQGCASLASVASPQEMSAPYALCISTADRFWELCMERLGSAKTMRSETDADFMCVMTGIVQDLLDASDSIFWTCASTVLIRLVSRLNGPAGLQHPDSAVRQLCVDVCGRILVHLHRDSVLLNDSSDLLEGILEGDTGGRDREGRPVRRSQGTIAEAAPRMVARSLTAGLGLDTPSAISSARFVLLRKLSEDLAKVETAHDDERAQEVAKLFQAAQDELAGRRVVPRTPDRGGSDVHGGVGNIGDGTGDGTGYAEDTANNGNSDVPEPDEEDMALVIKAMIHEQFLSAAPAMLTWLVEILESKHQSPSTRARAVKALGDVVNVDKRLLDAPSLLVAVEHSLQDDSISVREAALVLVGKHMVQDAALAVRLIHVVIRASEDAGSSVRKSAIKILRDCCLIIPEERSDKVIESYKAILNRSTDSEDSVKSFVVKIFKSLWFDPVAEGEDVRVHRTPQDRAKSLAKLADAIVSSMPSSGCRGLIDRSNPLVVLLQEIRDADQQGTAIALLDLFLYGDRASTTKATALTTGTGTANGPRHGSMSYLHAIYAMVLANPASCVPDRDPLKFLRTLAPHLKEDPRAVDGDQQSKEDAKMHAEEMLYVLGITSTILNSMEQSSSITVNLATDMSEELPNIINTHKFTAVVSAACACLSSCALSSPTATGRLLNVAAQYLAFLEKPEAYVKNLPRFIFIVGQVYRFAAARLLQQVDVFLPDQPALADKLTPASCMLVLNGFWTLDSLKTGASGSALGPASGPAIGSPALAAQIQRSALEAICQIMIAAPMSQIDGKSVAQQAIGKALSSDSAPAITLAALNGLIELIQVDALALHQRQSRDAATGAVAAENGEGDVTQSSAILQLHWDRILSLAMDSSPHQKVEEQTATMIRRKILFLIEISVRDGLCGPWSCLSTLVLFAMADGVARESGSSGVGSLCARSIKQLKLLMGKYPQYVDMGRIVKGIKDACPAGPRQKGHQKGRHREQAVAKLKAAQQRARKLYSEIVCPTRAKRNEFLRLLVRSFKGDKGSDLSSADVNMCCWLAVILAGLPYKKADEVCVVLHEIDAIAASKTASTVSDLHELLDIDQSILEENGGGGDGKRGRQNGGGGHEGAPSSSGHATAHRGRGGHDGVLTRAAVLCVMTRLKVYLMRGYSISPERLAVFASSSKATERGGERDATVTFSAKSAGDAATKRLFGVHAVPGLGASVLLEELDDETCFRKGETIDSISI